MKKFICVLLVMSLLSGFACAESALPEQGVITPLAEDASYDFDGDGTADPVEYEILREDGYDVGYRLKVGEAEITGEGWCMSETLNVLDPDDFEDILIMVTDYGPSDDYMTYFYLYKNGTLHSVGEIPALPEGMKVENGIITARIRGFALYTWFYDAQYALARSLGMDGQIPAALYRLPADFYPMNLVAELKVELPLCVSPADHSIGALIPAGEPVILCGSDDVEWVYIQSIDGVEKGWMQLDRETGFECIVGDQKLFSSDVFEGLLFAD